MSTEKAPDQDKPAPDGWSDLTPEEEAQLEADFDAADEAYRRGECIPMDEVLPKLRRAG